jgi:hypothetical protein
MRYQIYNNVGFSENTFGFELSDLNTAGNAASNFATHNHFNIVFDYETGKATAKITKYTNTTTEGTSVTKTIDFDTSIQLSKFVVGSDYTTRTPQFDNLVIKKIEGDYASSSTITYNYVDQDDNDITALVTANGGISSDTPDTDTEYTPTYPASFTDSEFAYDYTYLSGGNKFTVTEDATITIKYTKATHPTCDVKLAYSYSGSTKKEINIAEGYPVGKNITYPVYKYIFADGILYQISHSNYSKTVPAAATITEELVTSGIENVVAYVEGEEIEGSTNSNDISAASHNKAGRISSQSVFCNVGSGIYQVVAMFQTGNGSAGTKHGDAIIKAGEVTVGTKEVMGGTFNQSYTTDEFILTESTDLSISYSGGNVSGVDYIYVVRKGDSSVSIEVSSAGMATYVPSCDLNFSETDIKAYKAKVTAKGVCTLTAVDEVPAGTPVLLVKDGGANESIPVMAGAAAVTDNDLVAGTATTAADGVATTDGDYTNMILNNIGGKVGFYLANGQTVTANRAYLHFNSSLAPAAARMSIVFDDEATGINAVQGEGLKVNGSETVYNLNGQRVAAPQKGLFIMNGKKVIVK